MKILLDTCVVVDFLQQRKPFANAAHDIFNSIAAEKFLGFITVKSATDIYYLTRHCTHSEKETRAKLKRLLSILGLLDSAAEDIFRAVSSEISDFEDAVMVETAVRTHMTVLSQETRGTIKNPPCRFIRQSNFLILFRNEAVINIDGRSGNRIGSFAAA